MKNISKYCSLHMRKPTATGKYTFANALSCLRFRAYFARIFEQHEASKKWGMFSQTSTGVIFAH